LSSSPTELAKGILRKFSGLSFASARESAQVSGLARSNPELGKQTVRALANLLTFTLSQFNVGKNMSDVQVAILANDLLKAYWYWRFDEFAYVFGQALRGRWGTTYDRIDAATVNEWCAKFGAEREVLLTAESEAQANDYKRIELDGPAEPPLSPAARALCPELEQLSDEALQQGIDYYASLANPTPEQSTKLEAADAVAMERNRVRWAAHLLSLFRADIDGRTLAERVAETKQKTHAVGVALLQGNWQAAGFATAPSAEWLARINAPVNEPTDELPTRQQAA
jgi:hypothetical protein